MSEAKKKILIVDDRFEIRELITAALETGPYVLLAAETDEETLSLARAEAPDLILLDIQLVGSRRDGLEICTILKQENPNLCIVMLTAEGQQWDREASYAADADGYIVKPFSPLELRKHVAAWLQDRTEQEHPT